MRSLLIVYKLSWKTLPSKRKTNGAKKDEKPNAEKDTHTHTQNSVYKRMERKRMNEQNRRERYTHTQQQTYEIRKIEKINSTFSEFHSFSRFVSCNEKFANPLFCWTLVIFVSQSKLYLWGFIHLLCRCLVVARLSLQIFRENRFLDFMLS